MGGWYLLVYNYSSNQLKIEILLTFLLLYLLNYLLTYLLSYLLTYLLIYLLITEKRVGFNGSRKDFESQDQIFRFECSVSINLIFYVYINEYLLLHILFC